MEATATAKCRDLPSRNEVTAAGFEVYDFKSRNVIVFGLLGPRTNIDLRGCYYLTRGHFEGLSWTITKC